MKGNYFSTFLGNSTMAGEPGRAVGGTQEAEWQQQTVQPRKNPLRLEAFLGKIEMKNENEMNADASAARAAASAFVTAATKVKMVVKTKAAAEAAAAVAAAPAAAPAAASVSEEQKNLGPLNGPEYDKFFGFVDSDFWS